MPLNADATKNNDFSYNKCKVSSAAMNAFLSEFRIIIQQMYRHNSAILNILIMLVNNLNNGKYN